MAIASEQVEDPVLLAWGEAGRIWCGAYGGLVEGGL